MTSYISYRDYKLLLLHSTISSNDCLLESKVLHNQIQVYLKEDRPYHFIKPIKAQRCFQNKYQRNRRTNHKQTKGPQTAVHEQKRLLVFKHYSSTCHVGGRPAMLGHFCNALIVFDVNVAVIRGHHSNVERGQ